MLQPTAVVSEKREAAPLLIERMKSGADQLELEQMGRIFAPQRLVRSVEPLSKSR